MKIRHIATCMAITLLLFGSAGCKKLIGPGPAEIAEEWYEALGAFDTVQMYQLTHPDRRAELEADLENPLVTLGAAVGLQKSTFFDMEYEVIVKEGGVAQIRVVGRYANRLGMLEDLDEILELRRLDRQWYVWYGGDGL